MPWVKIDDQFPDHPKVLALGSDRLACMGLWVLALAYCNKHLTDGLVPVEALPRGSTALAERLVKVGLWGRKGTSGAYFVHDYDQYQPLRADVLALRSARREAGRRGGLRSGEVRKEANQQASASGLVEATGKHVAYGRLKPPSRPVPNGSINPPPGVPPNDRHVSLGAVLDDAIARRPMGFQPPANDSTEERNVDQSTVDRVTLTKGYPDQFLDPKAARRRYQAQAERLLKDDSLTDAERDHIRRHWTGEARP